MLPRELIEGLSNALAEAAAAVVDDLASGDIGDEDDFSSQLCGRLKSAANRWPDYGFKDELYDSEEISLAVDGPTPDIRVRARHLTSRGKSSEETRAGADIVLVVDINVEGLRFTKGVFIQAKMLKRGETLSTREWTRLKSQCRKMLRLTPAAYVFLCSTDGVIPFSANTIDTSERATVWDQEFYALRMLFQDLLVCWVGDKRIAGTDARSLQNLIDLLGIPDALAIELYSDPDAEDRWMPPGPAL